MRISDWSSDVCSSDLACAPQGGVAPAPDRLSIRRALALCAECRPGMEGRGDASRRPGRDARLRRPLGASAFGVAGIYRKRVLEGKSVSVRVDIVGRRTIKKNNNDN